MYASSADFLVMVIEPDAIVPQNLFLRLLTDWNGEELVQGVGPAAVDVRIVRRNNDIIVAHVVDDILHQRLVDIDGDEALLFEIFARFLPERNLRHLALHLPI